VCPSRPNEKTFYSETREKWPQTIGTEGFEDLQPCRRCVGERERIAKDAASAVQAAIKGGVVPGGGAIEIAVARELEKQRETVKGMAAYGIDCVIAALKSPLAQIVTNAGYNPLEKVENVVYYQTENKMYSIGINCDTGELADMVDMGILDPTLVKLYAIKAAGEIAEAILRINTIIKKRDDNLDKDQNIQPGLNENMYDLDF